MLFCYMCIVRLVSELDIIVSMYCVGLGFELFGSFIDYEGFSGIMFGVFEVGWYLEFIYCCYYFVIFLSGDEDLLVLYYLQQVVWEVQCVVMDVVGFLCVMVFNFYWEVNGVIFVDWDGYCMVL